MRTFFSWALSSTVAVLAFLAIDTRAAEDKSSKKIRVILIDGQNNHNWRATTPILKAILEETGRFSVDVSSNLKPGDKPGTIPNTAPFPPDLAKYDVLLSNYNGLSWPEDFDKSLEQRLKDGAIALVIVHAADNAFAGWSEFNRMIGLGWRNPGFGKRVITDNAGQVMVLEKGKGPGAGHGKRHPFKIVIRDADHPITKGMPREWMHAADELYHGLRGPAQDMHLLATAYSAVKTGGTGDNEPMIWTLAYGKGRVFHTPMGHDVEAMGCLGFAATVQRGTEWAATGKVTLPLPSKFPTPSEVSSRPPS